MLSELETIYVAVMDMMAKVSYNEANHTYQEIATGEWLQGVSSVSSIVPKDWLSAWGAKEAVKALGYSDYPEDTELAVEMMAQIAACKSPKEYIALLKDAKGASGRKSKTALVDGALGHAWLETWVKSQIRGEKAPKLPDGGLERPLTDFLAWAKENVDRWVLSEARVAYPEKKYAGTLDALAFMKNARLAIVDFKFASHISPDYFLQTAGYQATFEPYGVEIQDRIIVRLPKTLEREEWDPLAHKYRKVPNDLEVLEVPTPYELDRDIFFHCLPLKKWVNLVNDNHFPKPKVERQEATPKAAA